ncbi:MAG: ABC transporter ATP-binding protein [Firmicutes bacterium]|nr:ABC transporter ATP-binding protein [Bacillota bacterium]
MRRSVARIVSRGITKSYPLPHGTGRQVALQSVNLEVEDGEFVCLLGPSGCGKTTLLNIVSGLDGEYEGDLSFVRSGALVASTERPRIGYVFQEARLLPWLTVWQNLRFVLDRGNLSESQLGQRIAQWIERVGLAGFENYYPGQLSVGMQQRVGLARALIIEPEVLLMDEPLSALDELTAMRMRDELVRLWMERACTVLFVTHNPLEAVYLADRVVVMTSSPGQIVAELRVNELLSRPRDLEDARVWALSRKAVQLLENAVAKKAIDG